MTTTRNDLTVSVVMPAFRGGRHMEEAILSVANQTLQPLELIVVDDASDDDTAERVRRLQDRLGADWLKLIVQPQNGGPGNARNRGIDEAKGDFIAFLDADDLWHPRKNEMHCEAMLKFPSVGVSGIKSRQRQENSEERDPLIERVQNVTLNQQLVANRFSTSGTMIVAGLEQRFRAGGYFSEDALLWTRVLAAGHDGQQIDAPLVFSRKAAFGASGLSGQMKRMLEGQLENHRLLAEEGVIGVFRRYLLDCWSFARYARRKWVTWLRQSGQDAS